tara:strand:+ start:2769 stop:3047 length:279 start_codon:yes stop_codon:yes gene_type:complete
MADTTMQTFEHFKKIGKKMGERASKEHTELERHEAFSKGANAANLAIQNGTPINLMDEGRFYMSDLDFAETAGWNSRVFSEENKLLKAKLNR